MNKVEEVKVTINTLKKENELLKSTTRQMISVAHTLFLLITIPTILKYFFETNIIEYSIDISIVIGFVLISYINRRVKKRQKEK